MFFEHTASPVFDENSKILILGTFPSAKSREKRFFYGHPQNRFWWVLASVFGEETPVTTHEKIRFLLKNQIALWDVIHSCEVEGSSDSTIKNVTPNDISIILKTSYIKKIFANGKTSEKLYNKFIFPITKREIIPLPSTSPANASYSKEMLKKAWSVIKEV